jgi:cellulose 1,4-beta-cellobiosidase
MGSFHVVAAALCCFLLPIAVAQQAGTSKEEAHVPINLWTCTKAGGCTAAQTSITMDAQWRWTHDKQSSNCLTPKDAEWQAADAPDGKTAAANCAIEGMPLDDYATTYGVTTAPGGIKLNFVNGQSIGSRLRMMEDESTYKMFKLLNK